MATPAPGTPLKPVDVLKYVNIGMDTQKGPNGGAQVTKVEKFGSAVKAGIQVGDEIMLFDGKKPKTMEEVLTIFGAKGIGGTVPLQLIRGGKQMVVNMPIVAKRKTLSLDIEEVDAVLERKISP